MSDAPANATPAEQLGWEFDTCYAVGCQQTIERPKPPKRVAFCARCRDIAERGREVVDFEGVSREILTTAPTVDCGCCGGWSDPGDYDHPACERCRGTGASPLRDELDGYDEFQAGAYVATWQIVDAMLRLPARILNEPTVRVLIQQIGITNDA